MTYIGTAYITYWSKIKRIMRINIKRTIVLGRATESIYSEHKTQIALREL